MYLGHHRFLPKQHPVRKKGKYFKGEADHRTMPTCPTGDVIFDMVKNIEVVFRKGPGGQSVPKDVATGHTAMWKKKSIFWELPYWKVLEVRSSIDVMHVTKNVCVNLLDLPVSSNGYTFCPTVTRFVQRMPVSCNDYTFRPTV